MFDLTHYVPDIPFADIAFDITNIPDPVPPLAAVRDFFKVGRELFDSLHKVERQSEILDGLSFYGKMLMGAVEKRTRIIIPSVGTIP